MGLGGKSNEAGRDMPGTPTPAVIVAGSTGGSTYWTGAAAASSDGGGGLGSTGKGASAVKRTLSIVQKALPGVLANCTARNGAEGDVLANGFAPQPKAVLNLQQLYGVQHCVLFSEAVVPEQRLASHSHWILSALSPTKLSVALLPTPAADALSGIQLTDGFSVLLYLQGRANDAYL